VTDAHAVAGRLGPMQGRRKCPITDCLKMSVFGRFRSVAGSAEFQPGNLLCFLDWPDLPEVAPRIDYASVIMTMTIEQHHRVPKAVAVFSVKVILRHSHELTVK
jgi:hypothetical protein